MKVLITALLTFFCLAIHVDGEVRHVDATSTSPVPPYTNWSTAAVSIQDAVDVAETGDTVLVRPGVYSLGGRLVPGNPTTNRVVVTKPVTVQSTDGPGSTLVQGYQDPQATNGDTAIRGVFLGAGAVLSGFTVTGGATVTNMYQGQGGGVFCESESSMVIQCVITNNSAALGGGGAGGTWVGCTIGGNSAVFGGGGSVGGNLRDCLLTNNTASAGGGAEHSTLIRCSLYGNQAAEGGGMNLGVAEDSLFVTNSAYDGGGAHYGTLIRCTLTGNYAEGGGGGAYTCSLFNCLLVTNTASGGGGTSGGRVYRCSYVGNLAIDIYGYGITGYGGGASGGRLSNCTLVGNSASYGGGVSDGDLNHCTIVQNTAAFGGGVYSSGTIRKVSASNCIIYYNLGFWDGSDNYSLGDIDMDYCCTTNSSAPTAGVNTVTAPPLLASLEGGNLHLLTNSPCVDKGGNDFVTSLTDKDDQARVVGPAVDIGAYELQVPQSVETPRLEIQNLGNAVLVTWPLAASGYILERSTTLTQTNWDSIVDDLTVTNGRVSIIEGMYEPAGFYRLHRIKPN